MKAANLRVDVLTGQLTESEHRHNLVCGELEKLHAIESLKSLDPKSATGEFNQQIKARDDKINQVKKELDQLNHEMSDQMAQVNKKMMLVMNEKDHQIKVHLYIVAHGLKL